MRNTIHFSFSYLFLAIFFSFCFSSSAFSEDYYIAPSPLGNDSNDATQGQPLATFAQAFSLMASGDTLYVMDGVYNQQIKNIPSGTAGNYTKIYALNDHEAEIDGTGAGAVNNKALLLIEGAYIDIQGLRVHSPEGGNAAVVKMETGSSNIILRKTGIWEATNDKYSYPLRIGGSDILIEDCWVFGTGRYTVSITASGSNITLRRVISRFDRGSFNSEPIGGFAIYKGRDSTIENCITMDHANTAEGISTEHRGFQINSWKPTLPEAINNKIIGSIAINNPGASNGAFYMATQKDTLPDNNVFENNIAIGNARSFYVYAGIDLTLKHLTAINNSGGMKIGTKGEQILMTNNLAYNNGGSGFEDKSNSINDFNWNGYDGINDIVGFTAGANDVKDGPGVLRHELKSSSAYTISIEGEVVTASVDSALNDLEQNDKKHEPEDMIEIVGTELDGTTVTKVFTYGDIETGKNGITLGALKEFISASFISATASIDSGRIVLTADAAGPSALTLDIVDPVGDIGTTDHPDHVTTTTGGDPAILYPVRVESDSTYSGAGENGSDIGANVEKRYVDGDLTNVNLWPWPYEDWIKEDMCNFAFLAEIGRTGTDEPGWCTTDKTLTEYIWEYLGNEIPAGIYAPDNTPPAVPTGFREA